MTHVIPHKDQHRGHPAVLLGIGFVVGAAVGLGMGGMGLFSRSGQTAPKKEADGGASVTFNDGGKSEGQKGNPLDELLNTTRVQSGGFDRTRKVLAFVDGLKPGDLADRIDAVFARRRSNQDYDLINSLYQKWVEHDPAAALRHAGGLEGKDRKSALNVVLSAWAVLEPYEALAWMEEHGNSRELQSAAYAVLRAIALEDPAKAVELSSLKWLAGMNTSSLYGIWAEQDPQSASARAIAIPNAQERNNALQSLARQWAQKDPRAAWEWGNGLERSRDREAVHSSVIGAVNGEGDTSRAIAFLEGMAPGNARRSALQQIVSSMAASDPEAAYELARSQVENGKEGQVYYSLLYQWARTDPARAFEVALNDLDPGNSRNSAIQSIIGEVANRDVALAREMLQKLDDEAMHNSVYSVATALARNDVASALAWAEELPEGDAKKNAYSSILSEWAQEDPEKASVYGLQIEDVEIRRRSLQSVLNRWANEDAVEAMTWAVKNLEAKEQESLIPGSLLGTWVDQDAAGAAEWVAALPEGNLRKGSVSSLVSYWSRHDLSATGDWINRLKAGEGRDQAARQYSSQVFETDPEAALIWAESIRKEEDRFSQVENLARRYLQNDPAKARRWIAGSSLPPEKRDSLLEQGN